MKRVELCFCANSAVLNIPNGCLDAYEVEVNIDIFKYQEKVKPKIQQTKIAVTKI